MVPGPFRASSAWTKLPVNIRQTKSRFCRTAELSLNSCYWLPWFFVFYFTVLFLSWHNAFVTISFLFSLWVTIVYCFICRNIFLFFLFWLVLSLLFYWCSVIWIIVYLFVGVFTRTPGRLATSSFKLVGIQINKE